MHRSRACLWVRQEPWQLGEQAHLHKWEHASTTHRKTPRVQEQSPQPNLRVAIAPQRWKENKDLKMDITQFTSQHRLHTDVTPVENNVSKLNWVRPKELAGEEAASFLLAHLVWKFDRHWGQTVRDASRKRETGRQKEGIDSKRDGKREEMSDGKRESDAGSHFSHYQLAHKPPGRGFPGTRRGKAGEKCLWQQWLELSDMASELVSVWTRTPMHAGIHTLFSILVGIYINIISFSIVLHGRDQTLT